MTLILFTNAAAATQPQGPSLEIVTVALSLISIIALIIGLAWLVKRINPNVGNNQDFKVIRSLPLGTRERLLVIEIDDKQHLLGVTPQNINYLYQLETPLSENQAAPFVKELSRFMGQPIKKEK
ncbi:flagellar biosynthetic protein FliO [Pseudoalteromonas luteoviolacea]|uniref:Flagellar protein n=1 Tax=Pseudoalteromonas luteoviolacea TaxID=43657 RepID=A0A1C0TX77_9GAMM|nr:flagellar biosynthetic protein FliO [Pseudoalteromonas luteoviolacea]MBQ4810430.1 flagellar biosynthetic protein FliO [Pseudoalteromonas luteoviolacea]OCQ23923.1 flagellar biosynthetic protein FliO [Pseudoalteromonas luteoviolacea]